MPIGYVLLKPAFDILNFEIEILTTNTGNTIKIPLYAIIILLFIVEFIIIIWQSAMHTEGMNMQDYSEKRTYIDTDGVITGYSLHERRFKK